MDQLKKILADMVKYQFWIITSLAIVLGLVGWYLASNTMHSEFTKQTRAIDEQFSTLQTVSSTVATHPNDATQAKMNEIINAMQSDVKAAWESQHKRQEDILRWRPEVIASPSLVSKMQKLHPIELTLEFPNQPAPNQPTFVNAGERSTFSRYFDDQLPQLAKLIGVEWVGEDARAAAAGGAGMTMTGPGMTMTESDGTYTPPPMAIGNVPPKPRDIVVWSKASQDALLQSIRTWTDDMPTVYDIAYTQENIWILEGVLNVIKKTNGNAQANFQAAIKEIHSLEIGERASMSHGAIQLLTQVTEYGTTASEDMDIMPEDAYGSPYGSEDEFMEGTVRPIKDPADRRYVDAAFNPITGVDLRTRMKSTTPEDSYFAVAKRCPVRLQLTIDQRRIQEFITNCGNAALMLEVRQVRIGDGLSSGAMGGYAQMAMQTSPMDYQPGANNYAEGAMSNQPQNATLSPWDIMIEVQGTVSIYNPPDIGRLGLSKVTNETQVDGTVAPTEPSTQSGGAGPAQPATPDAATPTAPLGENGGVDAAPASDVPSAEGGASSPPIETPAPAETEPAIAP